ncbi:MAG: MoaD family protein [Candidatus Thorarchaeota archaeon]|nr:MoaD family protein [Candidatus Thorarchaeota archaeon]
MRFKSFGPLRRLIGEGIIDLEVKEGSTVFQIVSTVIDKWGSDAERLVMDGDDISGNLIVLLNMKDIDTMGGVNMPVKDGDEIAILPHVQGG